ncbi:MAG: phytoene desaturase family protein [Opitutales bacterium]
MSERPVAVVGGGLAGLSAAIHLRAAGARVVLFEKNESLGGKCNRLAHDGHHFDTGPSLLTLPDVLGSVFSAAGQRLEDHLELIRLSPACRYFFADGLRFDAPGDHEGFRTGVAEHFPDALAGFDRFWKYSKNLWQGAGQLFLFHPFEARTLLRVSPQQALAGLKALRPWTLRDCLEAFFSEPHLLQLFSRYATYNGSDPWRTPATFAVIAYAEMAFGSWHPKGGLYAMIQALTTLAEKLGVDIRIGDPVSEVRFEGNRPIGVVSERSGLMDTAACVVAMDAVSALTGAVLAGHPNAEAHRRRYAQVEASGSGFVRLMALESPRPDLACHNVFFCEDYPREFREIFDAPRPLSEPTIYVSVPSKVDATVAPAGKENWFVLVNAPSLDRHGDWPEAYGEAIEQQLWQRLGEGAATQVTWTKDLPPTFLQQRYNAWHGSIYGPSSNGLLSAFRRVRNRGLSPNLAFAGGSAHPGGGIPLALLSGRMAAEALGYRLSSPRR